MDPATDIENLGTEQLVNEMLMFLDDTEKEDDQSKEFDELKNPLCWAIKRIVNIFPNSEGSHSQDNTTFYANRVHLNQIEKACRFKDPYMTEVNRLMFCSTLGHPTNGSDEYYQAAENYALFGKEFLDFPTDIKFPQPMNVTGFEDVSSSFQLPLVKLQPPGFGVQMGKYTKQFTAPQQQLLVNQTNYCSYPFFQAQNMVQPLIYSNPFLMNQYLNMFVKETQINTSLLLQQQQQFLMGGIQERLGYAQMLQQQMQTNQALMSCSFVGGNVAGKCMPDNLKLGPTYRSGSNNVILEDMLEQ